MVADVDISQRWQILESIVGKQIGRMPELDDHLLFIGIREAGLPPNPFILKPKKPSSFKWPNVRFWLPPDILNWYG